MGPAHVALAWRQVAWVSACVASGATDGWGPRAREEKQKKVVRRPGFEPARCGARDGGLDHWAMLRVVMDLEGVGVLRCTRCGNF